MRKIPLGLMFLSFLTLIAGAQSRQFSREGLEFKLDLPSPSWRALPRVDVHEHPEFVNGDDMTNGYLRVRKRLIAAGATTEALFSEDEKWELQRLPGYVVCSGGKGTDFSGRLKGTTYSYEFVKEGKNMDGRIYYLQLDKRTFYVLHFTVASEKLPGLREEMDFIARSFRLKCSPQR